MIGYVYETKKADHLTETQCRYKECLMLQDEVESPPTLIAVSLSHGGFCFHKASVTQVV